jgi:hypothetical protein
MRRPRFLVALTVVLPALLLSGTAGAATSPQYDRLYLLGADTDYLYWGVDRFDPELGAGSVSRICGAAVYGIPDRSKPCLSGLVNTDGTRMFTLFFLPGSLLDESVTWSSAQPLRFHVEGAINTFGAPSTLHFIVQKGTDIVESPAATQTAPGVYEGEMSGGGPLTGNRVNFLGVRIRTSAPLAMITLDLAGKSYLQLPRAFSSRSVPDLVREDTYQPAPTSFASPTRALTFNDADWSVRSFTGTTGALRSFDLATTRKAEILMAWVEVFDTAFMQDIKQGREPDPNKVRQGAALRLMRGGDELDHSGNGNGIGGIGSEALSVLDLPAGPLTLQVDSANEDETQGIPFTVYVLEINGERTLRTLRWSFQQGPTLRVPSVGLCPRASEPVPATDEVRSLALDLDWQTEAPGIPAWTPAFDLPGVGAFPCGEAGTGDEVRLTVPAEQVWYVGATPAHDSLHVSDYDTTFQMTARYVYSAPPAV